MSQTKNLVQEIQTLIEEGMDWDAIASQYGIPYRWVVECHNLLEESDDSCYDDSMDGDHASALASVGWGTDEDYGYDGE
ncbi:hypothetical protein EBR96_09670 [bacterium]|nr:hypothetical protein [bacterium]